MAATRLWTVSLNRTYKECIDGHPFSLIHACQAETENLRSATAARIALWDKWLQPISKENPSGDDPGYDDDFQQIREEVNKLSGADSDRICALAEKLLTCTAKDIRIATYYTWARLQRDGENGLADGLELLAGLLQRFTGQLHPRRDRSRCTALEWLCSSRMLDSLSRYPEVVKTDTLRITGALWWIEHSLAEDPANPVLDSLYQALESRLITSGGVDAIVPQNVAETPLSSGDKLSRRSPPLPQDRICWHRHAGWQIIFAISRMAGYPPIT